MLKLSDIKSGDMLVPDDGFDCLKNNTPVRVKQTGGRLYVNCDEGYHFLDGQVDFDDQETLVGLKLPILGETYDTRR